MKVSVIIPTYNGKHRIGNLLSTLANQTFQVSEVIVVIDGSTDGTKEYLEQGDFGFTFSIFVQNNKGRAVVRNKGAELATGDLLIFFDDDMRLEPNCIEQHICHHQKHPNSILTGAQIDDYKKASSDFLKYKCWLSRKWSDPLNAYKGQPLPLNNLHLTAANFSIAKELFVKLGGFDSRLRDAEDFDLAIRAYKANVSIYYKHEAFAWHDDIVTATSYIKRLRQYQFAHRTLRRIKPEIYHNIELREPVQPHGLKKVLFSLFSNKLFLDIIDRRSNRLVFLPRIFRYKLYDLVTTSYGVFFTDRPI
ncbi:glycosyltransferase [Chitinophagaceae bacterium LB-8]|uniref:Glycosyltransferase n=1 Tax=Paraflavisolibacter caeni TaxID=2982496 RepID=A0A9X3B9H7_9BACT|nr:glycosyltransferase family 2 protein [Paraflavisolibacter caeni]MCU7551301.1 glycosyltransferase [Paraflavisolibacter caeni]